MGVSLSRSRQRVNSLTANEFEHEEPIYAEINSPVKVPIKRSSGFRGHNDYPSIQQAKNREKRIQVR